MLLILLEDTGKGEVLLRQCPALVDDLIPDSHFLAEEENESHSSPWDCHPAGAVFVERQPMISRAVPPGHSVVVNPAGIFDGEGFTDLPDQLVRRFDNVQAVR